MSGSLDITVEQGATFKRTITILNSSQVAIDVSGDTFSAQMRKRPQSEDISATFSTSLVSDGSDGQFELLLSDETTMGIIDGDYVYDVEWNKADGTKTRLLEGVAKVTPEVTR